MAVRSVDHNKIDACVDQRLRTFEACIAHGGCRSDAQSTQLILTGVRVENGFLNVLHGQQTGAFASFIHHQQFLDTPFLQHLACRFQIDWLADCRQIVRGHQRTDGCLFILGKANVAAGQDARQTLVVIDNGEAGDFVLLLQ